MEVVKSPNEQMEDYIARLEQMDGRDSSANELNENTIQGNNKPVSTSSQKNDSNNIVAGKSISAWLKVLKEDSDLVQQLACNEILKMTPVISLSSSGHAVIHEGTMANIQGGYGTHKSRFTSYFCALLISKNPSLEIAGFKKSNVMENYNVILYDTERPQKNRLPLAVQSIKEMAGFKRAEHPSNFVARSLIKIARAARQAVLKQDIEDMRRNNEDGKFFICLDICTDMVSNFNDVNEALEFMDYINFLINEHDVTFFVVIHTNRGGKESLGHLGSEIDRKATTKFLTSKNEEEKTITLVNTKQSEEAPLPDMIFSYDNELNQLVLDGVEMALKGINRDVFNPTC